jgi:hypothetical protein
MQEHDDCIIIDGDITMATPHAICWLIVYQMVRKTPKIAWGVAMVISPVIIIQSSLPCI